MLIASDRHTAEDLAYWREREEADLIWAQSRQLESKISRSVDAIAEFVRRGPCYCGISGGKDSAVVAALACRVDPSMPLRWLATEPLIDPYCREAVASIVSAVGATNFRSHINWCTRDATGWHATGTMESGFAEIRRETGTARYISGIRAEESSTRQMRCERWGESSINTCAPLAWWTAADVFAFCAAQQLPLHPTYGMTGGGRWPRERLRVSFLALAHGRGMGRSEWEREYYGAELRRIEAGH